MAESQNFDVHVYPRLVHPGQVLWLKPHGEHSFQVSETSLLIWVDLAPSDRFAHPTCTILIGAREVNVFQDSWWLVVDEKERFPPTEHTPPNVVFPMDVGSAQVHFLPRPIKPEDGLTDGKNGPKLPIHDESLVLWIDNEPKAKFEHATRYVIISNRGVQVIEGKERPTLGERPQMLDLQLAFAARQMMRFKRAP